MTKNKISSLEFDRLPIIEPLENTEISKQSILKLHVGDFFMTPSLIETQRGIKRKGDTVSIYRVIEVRDGGNIVYMPLYLELED